MRLLLFVFVAATSLAQTPLQEKIRAIATEAKGQVSVACSLPDPRSRPNTTRLVFDWMEAPSVSRRLKGDLPESVRVFHKTRTSGVHSGLASAGNDIGVIELPDGRRLAIAVFVTDSRADEAMRERVIAEIGRAAYEAAR